MKAIRIHKHGDIDVLQIDEIEKPEPGTDEVLVEVKAAAINHLDLWIRKGIREIRLPHIMGSDAAGTIESIGQLAADKSNFKIGDDVFVVPFRSCRRCIYCLAGDEQLCRHYKILGQQISGTQAEYLVVPVDYLMSKPKDLSWDETAAFPLAYLTAYHMLTKKTKINPLDWILIWGASSGIGSAAIQFARLFGARIIATVSSKEKSDFAVKLGCDHVVNYIDEDVSKKVKEFTEGVGVDIVFEHVGQESWNHSLRALKKGGKIITCGATTGALVRIDIRHIYIKHQQIIGSTMGNRSDLLEIVKLLEAGKLKPIVYKSLHFDKIQEAHKLLNGNKQQGKVVITF